MVKKNKSGRKISQVMQKIARKKRLKQLSIIIALIIVALIFITGSRGTYQLYKFKQKKAELEAEVNRLENEKISLQDTKDKIENDPEYIEKIAREKYKMKKKEEKVYQIVEE